MKGVEAVAIHGDRYKFVKRGRGGGLDAIHEYLLLKGVEAVAIHGDKGMSLLRGVGVGG